MAQVSCMSNESKRNTAQVRIKVIKVMAYALAQDVTSYTMSKGFFLVSVREVTYQRMLRMIQLGG